MDRKLIEVAGQLYAEAPKCRKFRSTIYPVRTPQGYPLADRLAARVEQTRAEQQAGINPLGDAAGRQLIATRVMRLDAPSCLVQARGTGVNGFACRPVVSARSAGYGTMAWWTPMWW